ncbi:MAG: YesL family protein [Firmicutes bacterium]|nr:YesL family protein [Bacillota bacterium]
MAALLDPESKPMLFLGKFWDAMVLHVIWIICCIPVITAGPATVALYFALMKDARDEGKYIRDFFQAFKRNFKQGLIAGLIYLIAGGVIGFAIFYYAHQSGGIMPLLRAVIGLLAVLYLFTFQYIWALIGRFENTLGEHFRNAFLFSIRHMGWTFLMCILMIAVYAIAVMGYLLILILGFGFIVYIDVYILNRIFRPYTKELDEQLNDPQ